MVLLYYPYANIITPKIYNMVLEVLFTFPFKMTMDKGTDKEEEQKTGFAKKPDPRLGQVRC
jgi:hypothetical protein